MHSLAPHRKDAPVAAPTFTFTILTPEFEVIYLDTAGSLAEGYAEANQIGSIRSVYTHAPQTGLVRFSNGSRYGGSDA